VWFGPDSGSCRWQCGCETRDCGGGWVCTMGTLDVRVADEASWLRAWLGRCGLDRLSHVPLHGRELMGLAQRSGVEEERATSHIRASSRCECCLRRRPWAWEAWLSLLVAGEVTMHGFVLAAEGRKGRKGLGNVVGPVDRVASRVAAKRMECSIGKFSSQPTHAGSARFWPLRWRWGSIGMAARNNCKLRAGLSPTSSTTVPTRRTGPVT